jgi:hypothetical protein
MLLLAGDRATFGEAVEVARHLSARSEFSLVLADQLVHIFQVIGDLRSTQRFDQIVYDKERDSPFIRVGHAQVQLYSGYEHWKACWEAFRDTACYTSPSRFDGAVPTWTGQAIGKGKILVYQEQGIGDAIIALRALPFLAARGVRFDLCVDPALASLAARAGGMEKLIASRSRPDPRALGCNYSICLFGLFASLDLDHTTLSRNPTLLVPSPDRAPQARSRIRALPGRRIGLAYGGNPQRRDDWFRAVSPGHLAPLSTLKGISWVNLSIDQRPDKAEVLEMLNATDPLQGLTDFEETAAIISELDAVVTIDSSVAHLAAAQGKRQWVLVPPLLDWRWQIGSDTKPWWPAVTLLRAPRPGQWTEVIEELARQI